jgi:hypothetical protein
MLSGAPTLQDIKTFLETADWLTSLCGPRDANARMLAWSLCKPCRSYTFTIICVEDLFEVLEEIFKSVECDERLCNCICWSTDTDFSNDGKHLWGKVCIAFEPSKVLRGFPY